MNDNELLDRFRSAPALTSMTPVSAVQARGTQIKQRRHRLVAGTGAIAAVAAIAVAVPLASGSSSHPAAQAGGTSISNSAVATTDSSAGGISSATGTASGRILLRDASFEVATAPGGKLTATFLQWNNQSDLDQLGKTLNAAGVRTIVRSGAQSCAYQTVPNFDISKVVSFNVDENVPTNVTAPTAVTTSAATTPTLSGNPGQTAASFNISPSSLPVGTTLQLWFNNPATTSTWGPYKFDLLPAGTPHC